MIHLGYTEGERPHPLGFSSAPVTSAQALTYDGDAPLLTFAPTGAGKGVSAVIPAALTWPGSLILLDPKGEALAVTARARQRLGQRVLAIDPFGMCQGLPGVENVALDPVRSLDRTNLNAADEARTLAAALVSRSPGVDPFWEQSARRLIASVMLWLMTDAGPEHQTMDVLRRIIHAGQSPLEDIADLMLRHGEVTGTIQEGGSLIRHSADKTYGSIQATAGASLAAFGSAAVLRNESLAGPTSHGRLLSALNGEQPVSLFLILPAERLDSHAGLLRVWITLILRAIARRTRLPARRTLLLVDEAAQLGALDELRTAFSLMRGYGLLTWLIYQSPAQLKLHFQDWEMFLENAGVVQSFGSSMPATRQSIAALMGGAAPPDHPAGQILAIAGHGVIAARRCDYRTDPVLHGLASPNPRFLSERGSPGIGRSGGSDLVVTQDGLS